MSSRQVIYNTSVFALPSNLKQIRQGLCNSLKNNGLSQRSSDDVVLAVDEACQNIIRHAYEFDESGRIDLEVYLTNNQLTVVLNDYAEPVQADCCKPKPKDKLIPGGLGTLFMNKLMDSVHYQCPPPEGVGNQLVMTRQLNK